MFKRMLDKLDWALGALGKEAEVLQTLNVEAEAALARMKRRDRSLAAQLEEAKGYCIFPAVGKAAVVLAGAYGLGEVFAGGKLIGYAAVASLTAGVQLGGATYSQLLVFRTSAALSAFKAGRLTFAADAGVVVVKAGAAAAAAGGVTSFVHLRGGMLVGAALGGQRFFFRPAALGRVISGVVGKGARAGGAGGGKPKRLKPSGPRARAPQRGTGAKRKPARRVRDVSQKRKDNQT